MQNIFKNSQEWLQFDHDHLWHPYTSMHDPLPCYAVLSAKGSKIMLDSGDALIDGMASWWSAIHGYNHPKLNAAIVAQTEKMAHVMFGGIAHQPASELGARLLNMMPDCFEHIFLADSGSISVEVAQKMALQYWQSSNNLKKQRFLTVKGGYHGDPFSCMSVGDPTNGAHHLFPTQITKHLYVARPEIGFDEPWDIDAVNELRAVIKTHHQSIAAIIVEPIVQGGVGMRFYHPQYLREMRSLCDEFDILLIFDEIATGFGRTGKLFAMQHAGIEPDIICVGKALTGGMMTLAATITTKKVAQTISLGDVPILMHGPTFMANPLACTVASASLDILLEIDAQTAQVYWQANVTRLAKALLKLQQLSGHKAVKQVRVLGAIGVVEMHENVDVARLQAEFVKRGVWLRPFGKLVYIMPPYILSNAEIEQLCDAIIEVIEQVY